MLTKFAVTNYRGFADRIEWDLSKPSNYEFNKHLIKDGTIKNGIIYGPNGSGKSNFSLAIFDIENHLSQKNKKSDYYHNFIFAGNANGIVTFEYAFKFGKDKVDYTYGKNASGTLLSEKLTVNNQVIVDLNKHQNVFFINNEFTLDPSIKDYFWNNANNPSIIRFLLATYPLVEGHYLLRIQQFVDSMLWFRHLDTREFIGLDADRTNTEEFIISKNLLDDFANFLLTESGQQFIFAKHKPNDKLICCKINGSLVPFQMIASTGTKSLQLLYFWMQRMAEASFVFIDEFDAFYHFELSFNVCKRLFALDCQIFTSSHNTYLMTNELLRPDCSFILNHNRIKCLADCTDKELREAHNLEKIYRAGFFEV